MIRNRFLSEAIPNFSCFFNICFSSSRAWRIASSLRAYFSLFFNGIPWEASALSMHPSNSPHRNGFTRLDFSKLYQSLSKKKSPTHRENHQHKVIKNTNNHQQCLSISSLDIHKNKIKKLMTQKADSFTQLILST